MKKLILIFISFVAVTFTINAADWNHFTTTAEQDAGAIFACTQEAGASCDSVQTRDFVTSKLLSVFDDWVEAKKQFEAQEEEIDIDEWMIPFAKDSDVPHNIKCTVFESKGVKAKYSAWAQRQEGGTACP